MTQHLAVIRITNLRLRTFIGINPDEIANKQDVVLNLEIHYPADAAVNTDEMDNGVNYKLITKQIIHYVESNQFSLLEKLTADVLDIARKPQPVCFASVRTDKPHALRFADSVSIEMQWHQPKES